MRFYFQLFTIVLAAICSPIYSQALDLERATQPNVILVMLDGVRWQEFFNRPDPTLSSGDQREILPYFWFHLAQEGTIFGNKALGSEMKIANPMGISLPAYQNIFTGSPQFCLTNICGRVGEETFAERLVRELDLPKDKVATIASWYTIRDAVEHTEGATFVNTGITPLDDGHKDSLVEILNEEQKSDTPPWHGARYDKYTFSHAMRYLRLHRPRFLFISLNDTDEWAHRGDYHSYLEALRQDDVWLRELIQALDEMGEYGKNTTLILTTDHGRGNGRDWKTHHIGVEGSEYIWLYAKGPHVKTGGLQFPGTVFSHNDLRPSIEALFGLHPHECKKCGRQIPEIVLDMGNDPNQRH